MATTLGILLDGETSCILLTACIRHEIRLDGFCRHGTRRWRRFWQLPPDAPHVICRQEAQREVDANAATFRGH